jgi:hypothetical protein
MIIQDNFFKNILVALQQQLDNFESPQSLQVALGVIQLPNSTNLRSDETLKLSMFQLFHVA